MSRKNFILTALIINFTICVTLCIVLFTGKDNNSSGSDKELKNDIQSEQSASDSPGKDMETTPELITDGADTESQSEEQTLEKEEDSKIVESQVQTDTQPSTYQKNEEQPTTQSGSEMTTVSTETTTQETAAIDMANVSTATVKSSCNVRSSADTGGNVVGMASAGTVYRIEPSACNSNWVAIYLDDTTLGYVAASFCTLN